MKAVPYHESGLCTPNLRYRDDVDWLPILLILFNLGMKTITPSERYL